jgi:hypothetical protein
MHGDIVSAIKFVAVHFSPVYLEKPMEFPATTCTRVLTKDRIICRIEQIVEVIQNAYFMAGALGMADFSEMHGVNPPPSEPVIHRSRELFSRLPTVVTSLASIEGATSEWLKTRVKKEAAPVHDAPRGETKRTTSKS